MREDRGFLCANEMQLGFKTFGQNLHYFGIRFLQILFETVQLSKRWTGPAAYEAGIIQGVSSLDDLPNIAFEKASELAPLAKNRDLYASQKEMLYGENAAINLNHGPAHMLKNSKDFES